jgi:hypothetical protein
MLNGIAKGGELPWKREPSPTEEKARSGYGIEDVDSDTRNARSEERLPPGRLVKKFESRTDWVLDETFFFHWSPAGDEG